jgi:YD repeat-containing protein
MEGESDLWVYDDTTSSTSWWPSLNNMTTSSATYNQDGQATSLINEHNYEWNSWAYGYDGDSNLIAVSLSEDWGFHYSIQASSVYRAFLVGVGDYKYFPDTHGNSDLPSPPYDVERMHDILNHSSSGFSLINELINLHATKLAILNGIANAFSGADADDVSYFYFAGHGLNSSGVSYLCSTDVSYYSPLSSYISTNELESALSAIPGTKVVILDSCHSGGFIGKQIGEEEISTNAQEFNDNVIDVFLSRDLTSSQYKVLTSCLSSQTAIELIPSEGDPWGLFSDVLCEGCGYDYYSHPYCADENANGEITLDEAYDYTDEQVNIIIDILNAPPYEWDIDQDTQVYPLNSDFVIIEE